MTRYYHAMKCRYSVHEDRLYRRRFTLLCDQLRLVYQPHIGIGSGLCVGAEALLRWNHPGLGAIGLAEFIPFIELSRLEQVTTAWVLETALDQQTAWRETGMVLQLSLKLSAANWKAPSASKAL